VAQIESLKADLVDFYCRIPPAVENGHVTTRLISVHHDIKVRLQWDLRDMLSSA